jgi:hypothetical protein
MAQASRATWLHLTTGIFWLFNAARDLSGETRLLSLTAAALFLMAACMGFMRMRRDSAR